MLNQRKTILVLLIALLLPGCATYISPYGAPSVRLGLGYGFQRPFVPNYGYGYGYGYRPLYPGFYGGYGRGWGRHGGWGHGGWR